MKIHFIYVNWNTNRDGDADVVLRKFVSGLGSSSWWKISSLYGDSDGHFVTKSIAPGLSIFTTITGSIPASPTGVVSTILEPLFTRTTNALPRSPDDQYVIILGQTTGYTFTDSSKLCPTPAESTDFGDFCGIHLNAISGSTNVIFSIMGSGSKCTTGCSPFAYGGYAPNVPVQYNPKVDGIISVLAHELTEAATDAYGAYYNPVEFTENADQCMLGHEFFPPILRAPVAPFGGYTSRFGAGTTDAPYTYWLIQGNVAVDKIGCYLEA